MTTIFDLDLNKDTNVMSFKKEVKPSEVDVVSTVVNTGEDEFYNDKVLDRYYSKNGMWMIEHENGEYEIKLKSNNGCWITVASYSTRNNDRDVVEDCKNYVRYVCILLKGDKE